MIECSWLRTLDGIFVCLCAVQNPPSRWPNTNGPRATLIYLSNAGIVEGTLRITESGEYVLTEDIVLHFNELLAAEMDMFWLAHYWLGEVESMMQMSLQKQLNLAYAHYFLPEDAAQTSASTASVC